MWERTRLPSLCIAGGCALNSVFNGKIRAQTPFREVYIQPAGGDNGTALGAAYDVWHRILHHERAFVMHHAYWGPSYNDAETLAQLRAEPDHATRFAIERFETPAAAARATARLIANGNVVGWYQGRNGMGGSRSRQPQHRRRSAPI